MKGGLGGHAAAATPEARKKQRVIGAAIGSAAVLAIGGSLAGDHRLSMALFGIAAGLMFVGVVYTFMNRRPR